MDNTRMIVLFASSSELDHERLRSVLKSSRCRCHSVSTCREAWMVLHEERVDVVISDTAFPEGLGWRDLLEEIRGMQDAPPLIVASWLADSRLWAEALDAGVFDILVKPFEANEVTHIIRLVRERSAIRRKPVSKTPDTVLVIDCPEVQGYVRNVLSRRGYTVLAPSPAEAQSAVKDCDFSVLITSQPEEFARCRPDVRILYIDVVPSREVLRRLPNKAVASLQKPFSSTQLLAMLERLLDQPAVATADIRQRSRMQMALTAPRPSPVSRTLFSMARDVSERSTMTRQTARHARAYRAYLWREALRSWSEIRALWVASPVFR